MNSVYNGDFIRKWLTVSASHLVNELLNLMQLDLSHSSLYLCIFRQLSLIVKIPKRLIPYQQIKLVL